MNVVNGFFKNLETFTLKVLKQLKQLVFRGMFTIYKRAFKTEKISKKFLKSKKSHKV